VPAPRAGGDPAAPTFAPLPDPLGPSVGDSVYEDDDPDDYDDERPRHPYTWLHLIVLALVAFVLGFLIVLLLSQRDDAAGTSAAATVESHQTHVLTGLPAGPA